MPKELIHSHLEIGKCTQARNWKFFQGLKSGVLYAWSKDEPNLRIHLISSSFPTILPPQFNKHHLRAHIKGLALKKGTVFPVLNEIADKKTSAPDSKNCSEVIDKQ